MTCEIYSQEQYTPWWTTSRHADRRPVLLARARIKSAIRTWFEAQGFVEVETACLQVSPGNETHLHAFKTELIGDDQTFRPLYLHTSPEFACKKLLAAGEEKIFTFAPVFRNREYGPLHQPEFTMLEWYRVDASMDDVILDATALLRLCAEVSLMPIVSWRQRHCVIGGKVETISVADAFQKHAGIDLTGTFDAGQCDRDALAGAAERVGITCALDDTWSDIFARVLTAKIEPQLGRERPTILRDYPWAEAAFARLNADDLRFAERFELYCCGIELANGFCELTDPVAQRSRCEQQMDAKQRLYGERYPIDEDFLAALGSMPAASGVAVGLDRLVMLATGAQRIDQVMWTPFE